MRFSVDPTRTRVLAALGGLVLVVAACSSSGATTAPSVAASAAPTAAGSAAAGDLAIAMASGDVGAYLTGADGRTLYIFTADSANTSVCVDACATKWPPLIVTGAAPTPASGVTGTFTTFARPDGSMQVALNGMPLYYYADDTKAGDTTGQGVGGKWFVAPPDGVLPSAEPSKGGVGY